MRNHILKPAYIMKFIACFTLTCFTYSFIIHQSVLGITTLVQDNAAVRQLQRSQEQLVIPARYGRITSGHDNGSQRLVVYVQDLHCNPEVQKNIAGILNLFETRYGVNKIYLEGAPAGKLDTSLLGSIPHAAIREKTIEGLVNKGLLGGGEYYALKFKQDKLYGLEEWEVYRENLERYRKLSLNKEAHKAVQAELAKKIDALKAHYFDRKLKRIEKIIASDRRESRYLRMEKLGERVGHVVTGYPNLSRYIAMIKLNRTIKYKRLSGELTKYVKELQRTVPLKEYMKLTEKMHNPDTRDEYYRQLMAIARRYSQGLERNYPEVSRFFSYMQLNYQINPINLIEEERLYQDRVMTQYATRLVDRDIIQLSRLAADLADYAGLSMTPAQYRDFSEQREMSKVLMHKYFEREEVLDALTLLANEEYPKFYDVNFQRNAIFVKTIAGMPDRYASPAAGADGYEGILSRIGEFKTIDFVIAGGFHLDAAKLINDKHISYLTITPSVTLEADGTIYDQIMTGKINYRQIITSALAPIADSLAIDQGTMVLIVAEIVAQAHRARLSPSEIVKEIAAWREVAPKKLQERMKVEFKDDRFDLSFRNSEKDAFSFVVGVKISGDNTVEISQAADGGGRVFTGKDNDAAQENIFKLVAGKIQGLLASGQMLGFSRYEMIEAVIENLQAAASFVPGIELRAFAEVLVQLLFDSAEKKHQSVLMRQRRLKITSEEQAPPFVRNIIHELGTANRAIQELVGGKNIIIKKVAGDYFPGKSSGGDLGFATMEVQGKEIIFFVSGKFWDRILRGPPDLLRLLLKHELDEYVFLSHDLSRTYHDFHAASNTEYAPLFEMASKKIVRSASQQVQDASHPGSIDRILGLVAERLGVSPASLRGSLGRLIEHIRGPPINLDAEENDVFAFIIKAYTLGMLHSSMGHLDNELDSVSIPVKKENKHGRAILFKIPVSTEKERLEVSIIGGGMNSYAAIINGHIVKYVKNPVWDVSADHDWSHDYGMQDGKLHQIVWEYIRANEKWSDFIVPTKVFVARSVYHALDREEQRKLRRFIKAGAVEIVTDSIYLHAENFPQGSGPADGKATVSVAIVQPVVRPLLEELRRLLSSGDRSAAKALIKKYVDYQKTMWRNGIFLDDATFSNVGVDAEGKIIAFDVEDAGIDPALEMPVRLFRIDELEHTNRWRLWGLDGDLGRYYEDEAEGDMFTIEGFKKIWKLHLPAPSAKQIRVLMRDPLVQSVLQALRGQYDEEAGDMSLEVTPLYDVTGEVLRAGIKTYKDEPLIIAVNPTNVAQLGSGKAWGSISLPLEEWGIQDDPSIMYHFKDILTGETFARSGAELHAKGLEFGLSAYRVHVLRISDVTISESSRLPKVLSLAMQKEYTKAFGHVSAPVKIRKQFFESPQAQLLLQVLRGQYAGMKGDRPLTVKPMESPDVITAGIKMYGGHPVVVAMNASAETQTGKPKAWGTISLPLKDLNIQNAPDIMYHFHDVISGAVFKRTGEELYDAGGLTVGLKPYQTHVFRISEDARSMVIHTLRHMRPGEQAPVGGDALSPGQFVFAHTAGPDIGSGVAVPESGPSRLEPLPDLVVPGSGRETVPSAKEISQAPAEKTPVHISLSDEELGLFYVSLQWMSRLLEIDIESKDNILYRLAQALYTQDVALSEMDAVLDELNAKLKSHGVEVNYKKYQGDNFLVFYAGDERAFELRIVDLSRKNDWHLMYFISPAYRVKGETWAMVIKKSDDARSISESITALLNRIQNGPDGGFAPLTIFRGVSGFLIKHHVPMPIVVPAMVIEELIIAQFAEFGDFSAMLGLFLANDDPGYEAAVGTFVKRHADGQVDAAGIKGIVQFAAKYNGLLRYAALAGGHFVYNIKNGTVGHFWKAKLEKQHIKRDAWPLALHPFAFYRQRTLSHIPPIAVAQREENEPFVAYYGRLLVSLKNILADIDALQKTSADNGLNHTASNLLVLTKDTIAAIKEDLENDYGSYVRSINRDQTVSRVFSDFVPDDTINEYYSRTKKWTDELVTSYNYLIDDYNKNMKWRVITVSIAQWAVTAAVLGAFVVIFGPHMAYLTAYKELIGTLILSTIAFTAMVFYWTNVITHVFWNYWVRLPAREKTVEAGIKAEAWKQHVLSGIESNLRSHPESQEFYESVKKQLLITIDAVAREMAKGTIDPRRVSPKLSKSDHVRPSVTGDSRIGFYPVAANPLHWGHLLVALQSMAEQKLDRVVFVPQGPGGIKPEADLTWEPRLKMLRELLPLFGGIFDVSTVSHDETGCGEETLFRFSEWNASAADKGGSLTIGYLVGSDHRHFWQKKVIAAHKGNSKFFEQDPSAYDFDTQLDTIGKLLKNIREHDAGLKGRHHRIAVFFSDRPGYIEKYDPVEMKRVRAARRLLKIVTIKGQTFESSSSAIRDLLIGIHSAEAIVTLPHAILLMVEHPDYRHYRAVAHVVALISRHPDLKQYNMEALVDRKLLLEERGIEADLTDEYHYLICPEEDLPQGQMENDEEPNDPSILQEGLAASLSPAVPAAAAAGKIANAVGALSWFETQQRAHPVLAGKSLLRVVPEVTDNVVRDMKTLKATTGMTVVAVSISETSGPGAYAGAFSVPYRGGTLLMQAHRHIIERGIEQLTLSVRFNNGFDDIRLADVSPAAIHGLVYALTQGDLVSLLSGVSPWLVEVDGAAMDEETKKRMGELPVLFRAARLVSYTDAPAQYEAALALGEQMRNEIGSDNVTRRGTLMVRAELAAVRDLDRSDLEAGTGGAVKGLMGKLNANDMSLQLDKLPLQVEANGQITKDAQLDDILSVPGISIVLDVPAGVDETIFAQEVESLLKAYKGLGIRLNLNNKAQIASVLRALGGKIDGTAPAALILVDVENDEQKQIVKNIAEETGLTYHPIRAANGVAALPGEAVEITIDPADASSLQQAPAKLSDSLETGDVVYRLKGQMPFTGEGDFWLTLFSFARSRELPSARGAKVARAALKGLGWLDARAGKDAESLRRIAAALTAVLRSFEQHTGEYSVRMDMLLRAVRSDMGLDGREIEFLETTINDIRRYIDNEKHDARRAVRGEILAGFTRELLAETAVRLSPVDRAGAEASGNLDQLKTYLVQLALQEHGENTYVMLMKMKLGLPVSDKRADEVTPENLDAAIVSARTAVLAKQGSGDAHQLFREFIAASESRDQSAAEVIGRIGNKAAAIMNRDKLDPESIAILLELYLTLRKDDFSKGFIESGIQSAQPALRAVEQLLSAA